MLIKSQDVLQQHAKVYGNGRIHIGFIRTILRERRQRLTDWVPVLVARKRMKNGYGPYYPIRLLFLTYHCRKATGHLWGEVGTAWFTMEIPVSEGPWKLCGIARSHLKAEDDRRHYSFECTGIEHLWTETTSFSHWKGFESNSP